METLSARVQTGAKDATDESRTDIATAMLDDHSDIIRNPARLAALHRTCLMDTAPEEAFDRLIRLASRTLDAPIILFTLVDGDRQFFKSHAGLPEDWPQHGMVLTQGFCPYVVASGEPLVIGHTLQAPAWIRGRSTGSEASTTTPA